MELKIEERPFYVSTGRIVDEEKNYVAATKTREQAIILVAANELYQNLISKFAND